MMLVPAFVRRGQRGSALISALIAFLVVSIGLLMVMRSQSQLRHSSDLSRQRSEAQRLAQADLERLRAFPALDGAAGWDGIANAVLDATPDGSQIAYTLSRSVFSADRAGYKAVRVTVAWNDARSGAQQVRLTTSIARHDPAYGGALTQPRHGRSVATVHGREARVPFTATDLGDGRSVLKLSETGAQAVVFDNANGAVSGRCSVSSGRRSADLVAADLTSCDQRRGVLVAGHVRFALGATPSAADANDAPLPFRMTIGAADGAVCGTDSRPAPDAFGERWAAYVCVVDTAGDASGAASGAMLAPTGWTLGSGTGQYRVCRYGASRRVDNDTAPSHQNFLVVMGTVACPSGTGE